MRIVNYRGPCVCCSGSDFDFARYYLLSDGGEGDHNAGRHNFSWADIITVTDIYNEGITSNEGIISNE